MLLLRRGKSAECMWAFSRKFPSLVGSSRMAVALPWIPEQAGFVIDFHGVSSFFVRQLNSHVAKSSVFTSDTTMRILGTDCTEM
jgi:hypothetical protein